MELNCFAIESEINHKSYLFPNHWSSCREGLGIPFDGVLLLVATGSPAVKMTSALQEEVEKNKIREERFSNRKPQQVR